MNGLAFVAQIFSDLTKIHSQTYIYYLSIDSIVSPMTDKPEPSQHRYSFTILGPPRVGKSNITSRFVNERFIEDYDPTLEGNFTHSTYLDNQQFIVTVTDTAGQQDFVALDAVWRNNRDGFVFVFAIDCLESYKEATSRLESACEQQRMNKKNIPCILVGNKLDLERKRQVPSRQAQDIAKKLGVRYLEVSAKQNINIQQIFHELIRQNELNRHYHWQNETVNTKSFMQSISEVCQKKCSVF